MACGPRALNAYIRQITCAHSITIKCSNIDSSEIWDKYYECCIENGLILQSEISHFQSNKSGIYP